MKSLRIEFHTDISAADMKILREKSSTQYLSSTEIPDPTPIGAFIFGETTDDSNRPALLGGIDGAIHDSWLYVDTLWVDESLRGQGYGIRLMQIVEQAAAAKGITRSFLGTSDFQAPKFYKQLGYKVIGEMPATVPDNTLYLMSREPLTPYDLPPETEIALQESPDEDVVQQLGQKLKDYNDTHTGSLSQDMLGGVFLYNDDTLVGGGIGWRFGRWLGIMALFVDEAWQNQGYERQVISRLEAVAAEHNLIGTVRETNPQLVDHYRAAGYEEIACIPDFPAKGQSMWGMVKQISP